MPTTPILLLEHIVQGQAQAEVFSNTAFDDLERKITNSANIAIGGTGAYTASADEVRDMRLNLTGVLTGNRDFDVPARNMLYLVENNTTGAFTVNFQVIGAVGVGLILDRGFQYWIWCDGTDIFDLSREMLDYVTDQTATYQATAGDRKISGDTAGGGFTITLPQVAPGKQVLITQISATNTLTIARGGSDTIKGLTTSITIATQWQAVLFVGASATNWFAFRLTVA